VIYYGNWFFGGGEVGASFVAKIPHRTKLLTGSRGKQTNLTSCYREKRGKVRN